MQLITFRPRGQNHKLEVTRPWTHLIKMPGLRGTPQVNVTCTVLYNKHGLLTPRRVRIKSNISLSTSEIKLVDPELTVKWSHLPSTMACSTSTLEFEHIVHIPESKPPARRVLSFDLKASIEKVTTLRDRLIIKGTASMAITYSE